VLPLAIFLSLLRLYFSFSRYFYAAPEKAANEEEKEH